MTASQRAAMNLQQRYGQQAAPQITQLQQQGGQQRPQGPSVAPFPKAEDQKMPLASLPAFPSSVPNIKPPVNAAQTDGASDSLAQWKAEVARRRELAVQNPGEGDRMLRQQLLEMQQRLEGGGLMLPLEQRFMSKAGVKRKVQSPLAASTSSTIDGATQPPTWISTSSLTAAQGDAAGDDDADGEADEDAINSDLDDPDQQEDDENSEENTDQMMLCTYDKVQRVKNKWKCTLKDGIVRVGGSE